MKKSLTAVAAAIAALALAGSASAHNVPGADQGGLRLTGTFSGTSQVGPDGLPNGDPDGTGSAIVTLNYGQAEICADYEIYNISFAGFTVTHIHEAAAGTNGPVRVFFGPLTPFSPDSGYVHACVPADRTLIDRLRDNPAGFYAHAHNGDYPAGVVRGQLSH